MSIASSATDGSAVDTTTDGPARPIARLYGIVFLLVGIVGFIPRITTHYSSMTFAGHLSGAMELGVFRVSVLHNVVHLLYGAAGLALARTHRTARSYLLVGGAVYGVLWVYGLAVGMGSRANFVPLNTADNWLHLALAVTMIAAGLLARRRTATTRTRTA